MKKGLTIIFFFALSLCASAQQTTTYEIDPVSRDSFFLREVITSQATQGDPRPQKTETNLLFKSAGDVLKLVEDLNKQAKEAEKRAQDAAVEAKTKAEMAKKIEDAMKKHMAFFTDKNKKAK